MDCIFCKIAKKEIPAKVVYEDDGAFAFLDINPLTAGHTMVIPKKHYEKLTDFAADDLKLFFAVVQKAIAMIEKGIHPHGFTLGINQGKAAGQVVEHFHFHIIPRFEGDNGGTIHSVVYNPPRETLDEIYRKIISSS